MKRLPPLVLKVRRCLGRLGIAPHGMVVAVSGGPDSVALLRALLVLRTSSETGPLIVAHLNHQLRGPESAADEAFVQQMHAQLVRGGCSGLELRSERADVLRQARAEGDNLESVARMMRYDWLAGVARRAGVGWVATGHTADDQAETVLHRILRGAGLKGLRGIAIRRPLSPGIELVRPLLTARRADVLAYLEAEGQPYCQDSSNLDKRFTRNRIRHELLPLLEKEYNPAVVTILNRLAKQADEAYHSDEAQAKKLLAAAEKPRAGRMLVFDRQCLCAAPRNLIREVFRLAWEREGWPVGRMNFDAWDRLASVALGEITAIDLPGDVCARCRDRVIQVEWATKEDRE